MTVLWAGGEDSDFIFQGVVAVDTTAGHFRSSFARCGLVPSATGVTNSPPTNRIETPVLAAMTDFWTHFQYFNVSTICPIGNNFAAFSSSDGIVRILLRGTGGSQQIKISKRDSAGTITDLATATGSLSGNSTLGQLDVHINYAVAGGVSVYNNGVLIATFTGDVTTDGVTQLTTIALCTAFGNAGSLSEVIIADTDTRSWSLQTFAPVANGNTHNFDVGSPAAANVNEITLNDSTLDGSTTAGQIDEYTCPAVASGTFAVQAFGVSARMQRGSSGPSKADLLVRTGGADFASSDQSLILAWANYQNWWQTNPNTSAAWATSEIGNASGFNIGVKSVT